MSAPPRRRSSTEDRNRPSRVRVAVRVRPVKPGTPLCLEEEPPALYFGHEGINKDFAFDHVFPGTATQEDVYVGSMRPFLTQFLNGFNVTVLAYGQTGAGKTYTVGHRASLSPCPSPDQPRSADKPASSFAGPDDGLIPRFLIDLFDALRNEPSVKKIHVSFLEIYCDEIHDLLSSARGGVGAHHTRASMGGSMGLSSIKERPLIIRDAEHRVVVENLTQVQVETAAKALELMNIGRSRQATGSNALNDQSSRSHAIYTVEVSRKFKADIKNAKLTFVDLAGSERLQKTNVQGMCMTESIQINVGLLALGNVINVLGEGRQKRRRSIDSSGANGDTVSFVPYRASKLTRLLREALGGNSMSLFIACVSPATSNSSETLCTLRYADRARGIQNKAQQNVETLNQSEAGSPVNPVVSPRRTLARTASEIEITRLQEQVLMLKHQLDMATAAAAEAVIRATTPKKPDSPSKRATPSKLVQPSFTSRIPKSSGSPESAVVTRSKSQGQAPNVRPSPLSRSKSQSAADNEENTKTPPVSQRPSMLVRPRIHSVDRTTKLELPVNADDSSSAPAPAPSKRKSSASTLAFKLFADQVNSTYTSKENEPPKEEEVMLACHVDNVEEFATLERTAMKSKLELNFSPDPCKTGKCVPDTVEVQNREDIYIEKLLRIRNGLGHKNRTCSDSSDGSVSQAIAPGCSEKTSTSPTLLRQPSAVGDFVRRQSPPSRLQTPRAAIKSENSALKSFLATVKAPIPAPPPSPTPSAPSSEPVSTPAPERRISARSSKLLSFLKNVGGSGRALVPSADTNPTEGMAAASSKTENKASADQVSGSADSNLQSSNDEHSFVIFAVIPQVEKTPINSPSPIVISNAEKGVEINEHPTASISSPNKPSNAPSQPLPAREEMLARNDVAAESKLQTPVSIIPNGFIVQPDPKVESEAVELSVTNHVYPRGAIFPEEPMDWELVDIPKATTDQSTQCDESTSIPEVQQIRSLGEKKVTDFVIDRYDWRGAIREHYKQRQGSSSRRRIGDRVRPIKFIPLDQEMKENNQDEMASSDIPQKCQLEQLLVDMRELILGTTSEKIDDDENQIHAEPLTITAFTEQMAMLLQTQSQSQQRVEVLTRQVRHLARLLGVYPVGKHLSTLPASIGMNSFEAIAALTNDQLGSYTLRYQETVLQAALAEGEALVVERIRARIQNFEQAAEASGDDRPPVDVFLSPDQYAACLSALPLGRKQLLPLVMTGWISIVRADLDAEIAWLAL